jgi:two-component system NtrC family sensor kinase
MMTRSYGLRFQIILSLALLITLLSGLLGFALISISSTAMIKERKASVRLTQMSAARSLVSVVVFGDSGNVLREMADSWLASGSIDGIWIMDGSGNLKAKFTGELLKDMAPRASFPPTEIYEEVRYETAGGGEVKGRHLFTQFPAGRGMGCVIVGTHEKRLQEDTFSLGTLLVLYLLIHGIAILAFGYFSITYLIVRPVERLRQKAVRLGEGRFSIERERRGAKEIQDVGEALSAAAARLKAQRDELVEKIEQLESARSEILKSQEDLVRSQKLASVGRLTAGVAHEIGNPLTAIIGFIDVLEDGDLTPEQRRDFLERMRKEAERVNRIIKDLLTFARAEGREIEKTDLAVVIRDACDIMRPQKIFKNVSLDVRLDDGAPPVMASKDRMKQVVINLLLNAAEAMVGEGRITMRLGPAEEGRIVELVVEDDGPGIAPDMRDSMFEPFVTSKPEGGGTGLGLSVCHGIVASFEGTLTARNRERGGARFTIRLPAVRE